MSSTPFRQPAVAIKEPVAQQSRADSLEQPASRGDRPAADLISRCKWCIKRIGHPRYRTGEHWTDNYPFLNKDLTLYDFTDGICPDCLAVEKAKIKRQYG